MSVGMLPDQMATMDDGYGTSEEVTQEELDFVRRIRARARQHQHSPYRKALLARVTAQTAAQAARIKLPGDGYQQYRLTFGTHQRYDLRDVEAARKATAELRLAMPGATPLSPPVHVFKPGDLVTPETDIEALTIDQDAGKFRPIGPGGEGSQNVDVLAAELQRLKQESGKREADLAAELDKLRAEVAEAKKANAKK